MSQRFQPEARTGEVLELTRMTKKGIQALCKKNKLYQTPELNDVLYLHYQGYRDIECLEEYTGLKCLWLENNAISEISGLNNQNILKCLFLNNNLIKKIENLEHCPELDTLNLSNNHISRIENCGVEQLPVLTTLILSHNYIRTAEQIEDVINCKMLSVLDLSHNRIEDILVVKVFAQMPELRVLDLDGNPVVSKIPQYRKTLIIECKNLAHLDRRPVFPRDRACAEAWKRGGYEEERREHLKWNKAERRRIRDSVNATICLRNKGGGDPQMELIASSSDDDTTERSSAPAKQKSPLQQVSDTSSIYENVQCVEYYDPESLPQPDSSRKVRKCQICGRVECNYVHIQSRPSPRKILEHPEDILEDSQLVLDGRGESFLGLESKCHANETLEDSISIPNISSIRYEAEVVDVPNDTQLTLEKTELLTLAENEGRHNALEVDLCQKPYDNYLDTVNQHLYIENKLNSVEDAQNQLANASRERIATEETNFVISSTQKIPEASMVSQAVQIETPSSEASPRVQQDALEAGIKHVTSTLKNEADLTKELSEQQAEQATTDKKENQLKNAPTPSEKKKVRLLVDSDAPENHGKIPTTPIPSRKGRKIDWNRMQDSIKRSKIDRNKQQEDILDIFADWLVNPFKGEILPSGESSINKNSTSLDINTLSSTLNDSSITIFPASENNVLSPIPSRKLTFPVSSHEDSSGQSYSFSENTVDILVEDDSSQNLVKYCPVEESVDDSLILAGVDKTPVTSIREFVSSYDTFLHSIEGKLQDLSIRCQTSCMPPEYLAEEANKIEQNVSVIELDTKNKPEEEEDRLEIVDADLHKADQTALSTEHIAERNKDIEDMTNQISLVEEDNVAKGSKDHLENIDDQPTNKVAGITTCDASAIPTNKSFAQIPESLSTSHHLQGFYTDQGRRKSEIIHRLLENPLTRNISAENICKDLRDTTEEMLRCLKQEKERRMNSVKETVNTVYAQKGQYEGTLEIINNELAVVRNVKCEEATIDGAYSSIIEKAKSRLCDRKMRSLNTEQSVIGQKDDSTSSTHSGSNQDEHKQDPSDSDEEFQDSCDFNDFFTNIIDEVLNSRESHIDNEFKESKQNDPSLYTIAKEVSVKDQSPHTSQTLDGNDIFHEVFPSYVISDASDGPDIFEEAQCDLGLQNHLLIDSLAENSTPRYPFQENELETSTHKSSSSCDVLLDTTVDTFSSSGWENKDMEEDPPGYVGTAREIQRHSGGIEHMKNYKAEDVVVKRLHLIEADSNGGSDLETEDSESHPVTSCFTSEKGRYTM